MTDNICFFLECFCPTPIPGYCFSVPTSISVKFQPNTRLIITLVINFALLGSTVAVENKNESNKFPFPSISNTLSLLLRHPPMLYELGDFQPHRTLQWNSI